jgi:tetratricopeptide (TPR) repeat protein
MLKWDTEQENITVHRVVQQILRTRVPETQRKAWVALSLRLLDAARPGNPTDVRTWPRWNLLHPHVAHAVVEADQVGITQPTAVSMSQLGLLLKAKALYKEAEPFLRRALAIDQRSLGQDHPNVAKDLSNLAQLLQDTNRLAEAEPLMRRALAIGEQSLGQDHPKVARDLNNLAQLLKDTNQLAEAEPLIRRALAIVLSFSSITGHEHPHLRTAIGNYEALLTETGLQPKEVQVRLKDLLRGIWHDLLNL